MTELEYTQPGRGAVDKKESAERLQLDEGGKKQAVNMYSPFLPLVPLKVKRRH